jgi:hypothetical protein
VKLGAVLEAVVEPRRWVRFAQRRSPFASFLTRLEWDAIDRPHYGYGLHQAARQADALGLTAISAFELGVAGGNGLVTLEALAAEVTAATGVRIEVYGFDAGGGMPDPVDYRDLPYVWQSGFFAMDADALRARLKRAELVLGDVRETIPAFVERGAFAPVGFVSFDLDYYSSTVHGFGLLDTPAPLRLPRVFCYFDDLVGDDWELHSRYTGELAAIAEYNEVHEQRKIAPINGLAHKRRIPAPWNDQIFVSHDFAHPLYDKHIHPSEWNLQLSGA